VTIKAFTVSHFSTLTCFGHYRPSTEGTSILPETSLLCYCHCHTASYDQHKTTTRSTFPRKIGGTRSAPTTKRKDKGHEPVRLKNFTFLTKSLINFNYTKESCCDFNKFGSCFKCILQLLYVYMFWGSEHAM
jgi:hypothetical protein